MSDKTNVLSPQQQAVLDFVANGKGNGRIEAVAGAGKTFTLLKTIAKTTGNVAVVVYNKKNAVEIEERIAALYPNLKNRVTAGTFHSFALRAWTKYAGRVQIDASKVKKLYNSTAFQGPKHLEKFALSAVSLARQVGIGALIPANDTFAWMDMIERHSLADDLPNGTSKTELGYPIEVAKSLLEAVNDASSRVIDFDDMIYQPLRVGASFFGNDWVLVDECQDLNPVRRKIARKMMGRNGRAIFVGDPRQAIYGFTGADADSFDLIKEEFNTTDLPLTTTYRCPKQVVAEAQKYVPGIFAHETAPEGSVLHIAEDEWKKNLKLLEPGRDAVLCRVTRPLVALCYTLIRAGVPAKIEGRSIGDGLIKLVDKWKLSSLDNLVGRLADFRKKEVEKLMNEGKENLAEAVADKVDTVLAIIEELPDNSTIDTLRQKITDLFEDTSGAKRPVVVFSTIHRAKGLEWETVHWYGPDRYQPSKYARQDWQLDQESNLMYVAATRAKNELVIVNLDAVPEPVSGGAY